MTQAAFDTAQDAADARTGTGALAKCVPLGSIQDGYQIYHDRQIAPYAELGHWGTRPLEIKPKNRSVLRWVTGTGGGTRFAFAKQLMHPGYGGDAWMLRARDAAEAALVRAAKDAV